MAKAVSAFDLSSVQAVALDETASKHGQNYVTVFIDMQRSQQPVLFVTPGQGKVTLEAFANFMRAHKGNPEEVLEVVCDMSGAFLSAVPKHLPNAEITVDGFHIVQTFTRALDDARKAEAQVIPLPKHLRWAVLKRGKAGRLTTNQLEAMAELLDQGLEPPRHGESRNDCFGYAWRGRHRRRVGKSPDSSAMPRN